MASWSKGRFLAVLLAIGVFGPDPGQAQSANQGVAIGGNVSGSTINVGLSQKGAEALVQAATSKWKNLTSEQRGQLRQLERELGVTEGALRTFFSILGENNVAADMLPERLGQIAAQHLALKTQLAVGAGEAPQLVQLKKAARSALDAGRFDQADAALREIEALQETALDGQLRERIQTAEQRATLAKSRLRFNEAAEQYAVAERYAADDEARFGYQRERARALLEQADEFDDAAAQQKAVGLLRSGLAWRNKAADPEGWSRARRDLGYALIYRGVEKTTVAEADEAVELFDQASGVQNLITNVVYLSELKHTYGQILCNIGGYRNDTKLLNKGYTVFKDAIIFLKKNGDQVGAAITEMSLSNCIASDKTPTYDFKTMINMRQFLYSATKQFDKEKLPFDWSQSIINFASMDITIARQEKLPDYYFESAMFFLKSLDVLSAQSSPRLWEEGQFGLGDALYGLNEQSLNVDRLELAFEDLDAFVASLAARPIAERSYLELLRFQTKLDLGYALEDPATVRSALESLKVKGLSANVLSDDVRGQLVEAESTAKAWLAHPAESPSARDPTGHKTRLGLLQLQLDLTTAATTTPAARAAAFGEAIKGIRRCRDGERVAKAIGATTVWNEDIRADALPQALRDMIAVMKIGNASPLFGEKGKSFRSLVLCGRKIGEQQ